MPTFEGMRVTEHRFAVPLDHARPGSEEITVFARSVAAEGRENDRLPWLVFLQGGPGSPAPRPMTRSGWIDRALEEYRVLLLDQRGTGCSTPATFQSLARLDSAAAQAEHLTHFRSDAIVRDCELIRRALCGDEPWTVLGQSYGGFCATRYLGAAPEGLASVLIAGGLPPLTAHPDEIYRRTYPRLEERNRLYYERYPDDVERVRAIVARLRASDVRLPRGDRLSVRGFQQLGLLLGFSDGFEIVHNLLEQAFVPGGDELAYTFLRGFENTLYYDTSPIFSVLHEACYTQGFASRWSAERLRAEHPAFDADRTDGPVHFTGEMIYPWMFEEIGTLRPLREAAELLAAKEDWPVLYDAEALGRNEVPCAAAVYADDMYVVPELSLETARAIAGIRVWETDEYLHNGLRAEGKAVLGRLLKMLA